VRNIATALLAALCVAACGGSGSSLGSGGTGGGTGGSTQNVQSVVVDAGPAALGNMPADNTLYTTVTICAPGSTTQCQSIDHIQVDTGSSGFRVLASVLMISLPLVTASNGEAFAECLPFVDGSSFGPLRTADIKVAGEVASSAEIEVIGDSAYPNIPAACTGKPENSVQQFGANGIIGVGPFISDCGSGCETVGTGVYYTCPTTGTCTETGMPIAQQVSNPVASFATDNNGVLIELPSVSASGAASVSGSLIFGIGTQSNNGLGSAGIYTLVTEANATANSQPGDLTTIFNSSSLTESFIDSGSSAYFFPDSGIPLCTTNTDFYCPTATLSLSATIEGINGTSSVVNFGVANADQLASGAAFPDIAASSTATAGNSGLNGSISFDWGLPFYYNRHVYTMIEGKTSGNAATGTVGPYFAF